MLYLILALCGLSVALQFRILENQEKIRGMLTDVSRVIYRHFPKIEPTHVLRPKTPKREKKAEIKKLHKDE